MKAAIHPKWFSDAKVICACGNTFTVGAVVAEINVEVCSKCHPFYTGQMKYLDAAGRVEAFKSKMSQAAKTVISKTEKRRIKQEKRIKEELSRPESLDQLRSDNQKTQKTQKIS